MVTIPTVKAFPESSETVSAKVIGPKSKLSPVANEPANVTVDEDLAINPAENENVSDAAFPSTSAPVLANVTVLSIVVLASIRNEYAPASGLSVVAVKACCSVTNPVLVASIWKVVVFTVP